MEAKISPLDKEVSHFQNMVFMRLFRHTTKLFLFEEHLQIKDILQHKTFCLLPELKFIEDILKELHVKNECTISLSTFKSLEEFKSQDHIQQVKILSQLYSR